MGIKGQPSGTYNTSLHELAFQELISRSLNRPEPASSCIYHLLKLRPPRTLLTPPMPNATSVFRPRNCLLPHVVNEDATLQLVPDTDKQRSDKSENSDSLRLDRYGILAA